MKLFKIGILNITLKSIWWWSSSAENLVTIEHIFITIALRSTLTFVDNECTFQHGGQRLRWWGTRSPMILASAINLKVFDHLGNLTSVWYCFQTEIPYLSSLNNLERFLFHQPMHNFTIFDKIYKNFPAKKSKKKKIMRSTAKIFETTVFFNDHETPCACITISLKPLALVKTKVSSLP